MSSRIHYVGWAVILPSPYNLEYIYQINVAVSLDTHL